MKIIKCKIVNFGVLSNVEFDLSNQLTTIIKDNGSGKSTLAAFIKAMFYGLPNSSRSNDLNENERKKYTPWQGGIFGGSMEIEYQNHILRIERTFGQTQKSDKFNLIDLKTNKESNIFSDDIGKEIFGVSSSSYEKSSYFPQKELDDSLSSDISQKLVSFMEDSKNTVNYEKAIKKLSERKNRLQANSKNGLIISIAKEIWELELELEEMNRKYATLKSKETQIEVLSGEIKNLKAKVVAIKEEIKLNNDNLTLKEIKDNYISYDRQIKQIEKEIEEVKKTLCDQEIINELNDKCNELNVIERNISEEMAKDFSSLNELMARNIDKVNSETIEKIDGKISDYKYRKNLLQKPGSSESLEYETLFNKFGNNNGIEKELAETYDKIKKLQNLENKKIERMFPFHYISLGFLIISLVILFFNLNNTTLIVLFASLAVVFGIAAITLFLFSRKYNNKKQNDRVNEIRILKVEIENFLHLFEETFINYELAMNSINTQLTRFKSLKIDFEDVNNKSANDIQIIENISNSIKEDFNKYLITINDEDFDLALSELKKLYDKYKSLIDKKEKSQKYLEELTLKKSQLNQEIIQVFLKYNITTIDYQQGLEELRSRISLYKSLLSSKEKSIKQKQEYIENKKINQDILEQEVHVVDSEYLINKEQEFQNELTQHEKEKAKLEQEYSQISKECESISFLEDSIEEKKDLCVQYKKEYDIIEKTILFLGKAKDELSRNYLKPMNDTLIKYIHEIDEDFNDITFNSDLEVTINRYGSGKSLGYLSEGCKDLIDFCIRLALVENLYKAEKPTLILDDPFANYDDGKLKKGLNLLKKLSNEYQIIYLICHSSRK